MVADAPGKGPAVTAAADDRITAVGRVLRKAKLDELPQLINVLKGEMSLVGPRPEDPSYVSLYSRDQLAILDTRPGITSPASISYRDESSLLTGEDWEQHYTQEVMPAKIELDLEYARGRTWRSDLGVIVRTITSLGGGGRNERKDGQGGNRPFDA
jgi:lipopolysaccharide/colanic/teichoic acid biosynthesis glycosyltransferase